MVLYTKKRAKNKLDLLQILWNKTHSVLPSTNISDHFKKKGMQAMTTLNNGKQSKAALPKQVRLTT